MIVEVKTVPSTGHRCKRIMTIECDACGTRHERKYGAGLLSMSAHSCSRQCLNVLTKRSGPVGQARAATCLKVYGVESTASAPDVRRRMVRTCLERFGAESPLSNPTVRARGEATCLERYGTSNAASSAVVIAEIKETFAERYVGGHPARDPGVNERRMQTCLTRYGVEHAVAAPGARERSRQTSLMRYGTEHPRQSEAVKAKVDFRAVWKKAHETKKRNGTYARSRQEDFLHAVLVELLGHDDVVRAVPVEHGSGVWHIDLKILSLDTYVQLDGVYWHGLDRTVEQLRESTSSRDAAILQAYERDRVQDAWFAAHGMRLVRVTDRELRLYPVACLMRVLESTPCADESSCSHT